jgi:hypothetical protein
MLSRLFWRLRLCFLSRDDLYTVHTALLYSKHYRITHLRPGLDRVLNAIERAVP